MREQRNQEGVGGAAALDDEPRDVPFVSPLGPLLEEFLGTPLGAAGCDGLESPLATVLEDHASYRVMLAVPGSRAEDLSIEVLQDRVTVCGTKLLDAAASRNGRSEYAFVRSFRLPFDVDPERAQATLDDGLLTLAFAKRSQPGPRSIEIATPGAASRGGDPDAS